jgi:hypothetical protein
MSDTPTCWCGMVDCPIRDRSGGSVNGQTCWCGHPELHDAGTAFIHAVEDSLHLPQLVQWLEKQLGRWHRDST